MKKYCLFFLFSTLSSIGLSQSIYGSFGPQYTHHKDEISIREEIEGKRLGNDQYYRSFGLRFPITQRVHISADFTKYPLTSIFHFRTVDGFRTGYGWPKFSNVKLYRAKLGYNLILNRKFFIIPSIALGWQSSVPVGSELGGVVPASDLSPLFEQIDRIDDQAYNVTQFVTGAGVKLGFLFWNRFELFMNIDYVRGFKRTSQLTLKYNFDGVRQPDAIRYTDGSATLIGFGIGLRLWNRFD